MKVEDVMSKRVITISPDDNMLHAAQLMRDANVGCLIVVGSGVQGIVTDRDLTVSCTAKGHNPEQCRVGNHMSQPVITIRPDVDMLDAAHTIIVNKTKRLPVVEGDQLKGLISMSDIAQAMDRPMHDLLLGMGAARRAS
ncbi:MAG: CBS domain-containing protein [Dehalococcoidia bacterium]|nr:CBS domain-containing protein [Dehalococcoidia bacterium]